jgi:hypothetical protein
MQLKKGSFAMKFKHVLLGATSLAISIHLLGDINTNRGTFMQRPFCMDMAREIMAEQSAWVNMQDNQNWFGTIQATVQYYQNMNTTNPTGMGAYPFWTGTNSMTVGNNAFGTTQNFDVDAYQFGLGPVTTSGTISISPIMYSAGVNFLLYAGNYEYEPGVFGKIQFAIGASFMDPQFKETPSIQGVPYAIGEMSTPAGFDATLGPIYANMAQAFAGFAVAGTPLNSIYTGLQFGTIDGKRSTQADISDMDLAVGYNFLANDHSHVGIALRLSIPLAKKPTSIYVLEPTFGKGGGWGIGGELISHGILWEKNKDRYLEIWVDGYMMHLFKSDYIRTYDLKNNAGSRYLLIGDFGTTGTVSQNSYQPLMNQSALLTFSIFPMIVDAAALLQYNHDNWQFGLGYNIAGKTQEKLLLVDNYVVQEFALVGQQPNLNGILVSNRTDSTAKINRAMQIAAGAGPLATPAICLQDGNFALDINGATQPAGWTSKIFMQIAYKWLESDFCPTLATQGSTEFTQTGNSAVSQWSIGIRGGISF